MWMKNNADLGQMTFIRNQLMLSYIVFKRGYIVLKVMRSVCSIGCIRRFFFLPILGTRPDPQNWEFFVSF